MRTLTPNGLGLRLDPADSVEDENAAVQHSHRTLHLDGEVHMAGGVDELQQVLAPGRLRHGGGNGDAVPLLLDQIVHVSRAIMNLANLIGGAGIEKDALGERGLTRIHMSGNPDIANVRQSGRFFHRLSRNQGHD